MVRRIATPLSLLPGSKPGQRLQLQHSGMKLGGILLQWEQINLIRSATALDNRSSFNLRLRDHRLLEPR